MEETLKTAQVAGAKSQADRNRAMVVSLKWAFTIPQVNCRCDSAWLEVLEKRLEEVFLDC